MSFRDLRPGRVVDPSGHFLQQDVVLYVVEENSQVYVDDVCAATRCTVVLLGQRVGFSQRLLFADVDEKARETPGPFGLRLDALGVKGLCFHLRAEAVDVEFRTPRLKKCYEEERERVREWGEKVARVYVRRVDTIYAARSAQDLHALAALRFHPLKGDRTGQHAIWLTEFMRLIVTFKDDAMTIVQIEEVSKHYGD